MKKILLVCAAGMSTSMLVKRMIDHATAISLEVNISALAIAEAKGKIKNNEVDVVLLGPQVRFQKPEIEAVAQGKMPVAVIEMKDYGTMNGQAVLEFAMKLVTGAVEVVLVANSVIDISVGSPFSIPQMFSARLGIATMAICPIMVSFSVAAINSLMKQVALRADFDFLTQVYSRSGLYEALKSPSLKQTQHLTVMLLDIDYFKSINDNYGHECGDKVLSVFAQHIQKIVGDKGLVARMGGEEFAVAVPSVNPVDGLLMAEKIRKGVELQPFTWQQKTLYLTVSIGVGSGCASYRTLTDDFNKLMVEADTCLYRSKKDGRNRTSTMRYGEEVV